MLYPEFFGLLESFVCFYPLNFNQSHAHLIQVSPSYAMVKDWWSGGAATGFPSIYDLRADKLVLI